MAEKVTTMVLKVDLQCPHCYKKVKKILCKVPRSKEIRGQVYDAKKNTVTITVVCDNPEKIRVKLRCKGGKTIQGIEIVVPEPPEPPVKTPPPEPPVPPCKTVHVCVPVYPVGPCKQCSEPTPCKGSPQPPYGSH